MKNYVQPGVNLTIPAPYDVLSGGVVIQNSISGVAAEDALAGADVDVVTLGVFTLPKVSALAISVGAKVYWDSIAKLITTTATANTLIGLATAAAANPSGNVTVKLGVPV